MKLAALPLVIGILLVSQPVAAEPDQDCLDKAGYWATQMEETTGYRGKQAFAESSLAFSKLYELGADCAPQGGGGVAGEPDALGKEQNTPGFGLVAVVATLGAALFLARRRL